MKRKMVVIVCCTLSILLFGGIIVSYQKINNTKYIMRCVFFPWVVTDFNKSYFFTLTEDGVFTSSVGAYRATIKMETMENNLRKNKVLKKVDTTTDKRLSTTELSDLENSLNELGKLKPGGYTDEALTINSGWNVMIIYKGESYYFFYLSDNFEDFTNIADKIKELSSIPVDWNINYQ